MVYAPVFWYTALFYGITMKQIFSAGVVVFAQENDRTEYLLLHYPAGHWDLPKGKIEEGETKQETALRELYEETRLHTKLKNGFEEELYYYFHDFKGNKVKKTVYFFVGQTEKQEIIISEEHQGYDWLPYGPALKQLTFECAKELLKKAHKFIESNKKK